VVSCPGGQTAHSERRLILIGVDVAGNGVCGWDGVVEWGTPELHWSIVLSVACLCDSLLYWTVAVAIVETVASGGIADQFV
jgi:hypothetical protein